MSTPQSTHDNARLTAALVALLCIAAPRLASAQVDVAVDIEVPAIILEDRKGDEPTDDPDLDLANIVQTAAKGVTTVQEAPAIVTVITEDEIRDGGYENLEQVLDRVPGWLRLGGLHSLFPFPLTRGTMQATMLMHNGIAMFDPMLNVPSVSRIQPLETIKRIEMITGPGGVLWGANSYLGILNLITKDADDVEGVEANIALGHGDGDREFLRGYVMAGPKFGDSAKLFIHTSFETFRGSALGLSQHAFAAPLPQPNSDLQYGPFTIGQPPRSFVFNLSGKLSLGSKLNFYFQAPFVERHTPLGISGFVTQEDRVEDTLRDPNTGELLCPDDGVFDPSDRCLDRARRARDNQANFFERYAVGEYRTRLADGKAGVTVKGYLVQFVRDFHQLGILSEVEGLLEGGLGFRFDATNYRAGGLIDGDIELPNNARLLYGVEAFHEWVPVNTDRSRQAKGVQATFAGPDQLERLPLPCPKQPSTDDQGNFTGASEFLPDCPLTFLFETSRTVMGAYMNPQWKISRKLTLDGGVRLQAAPTSLGKIGYDLVPLFSGSAVYGFMPNWHLKLNYAQGFRAPVFNNTDSNGNAVQIPGDRDLKVETSQAYQGEINARLWRGKRRIRELNFRMDYSYTELENLIQFTQGKYANAGKRGMHSVEFLGKLYVKGGHRIEAGYTFLRINTEDKGRFRAMPEHWFNLSGVFRLNRKLSFTNNLRVLGAHEDPNRLIEHRDFAYDPMTGRPYNTVSGTPGSFQLKLVEPHEVVLDKLPPTADLTMGLIYAPSKRLRLTALAYNAFNARYFQPDGFFDYEPRLEFLPNPSDAFRFKVNATYTY